MKHKLTDIFFYIATACFLVLVLVLEIGTGIRCIEHDIFLLIGYILACVIADMFLLALVTLE